jgi:Tol biopolymer transport system component
VFFSLLDGENYHLAVWTIDTGNVSILTKTQNDDYAPAISPDEKEITWVRSPKMILKKSGSAEIYWSPWPNFNEQRLTHNNRMDAYPTFLPDSRGIVFESCNLTHGYCGLYLVDTDGTEKPLIYDPEKTANGIPSSSGNYVVFERALADRPDYYGVAMINVASPQNPPVWLSNQSSGINPSPRFSPDGQKIAYYYHLENSSQLGVIVQNFYPDTMNISQNKSQITIIKYQNDDLKLPRWNHQGTLLAAEDRTYQKLVIFDLNQNIFELSHSKNYRTQRFLEIYNFDIY